MLRLSHWKLFLASVAGALCIASVASAEKFSIPPGELSAALDAYTAQTGIGLIVSADAVKGVRTRGVRGDVSANDALQEILPGTGFVERHEATAIAIVHNFQRGASDVLPEKVAAAMALSAPGASLETVTVTSSQKSAAMCRTFRFRLRRLARSS